MKTSNTRKIFFIVCIILLLPLLGNVFIDGWNWGLLDFVFAGSLFFATGLAIDHVLRTVSRPLYRIVLSAGILFTLFLIWIELAVDGVSQIFTLFFK